MTFSKNRSYILIISLAVIWGSSFILMKRALLVYTPFQIGAFRMLVAFVCMFPIVAKHFKKIDKSKWKYIAASGIFGNALPSILFPLAETRISSAVAGMINSLTPLFTLIIGLLVFKMKAQQNKVIGLVIGLFGAVLLVFGQTGGAGVSDTNVFALFVVLATVFYAISVNILRYKLNSIDSILNTGFALLFAGVPMGIILFTTDFVARTNTADGAGFSLFCIVVLGVLGTGLSTLLFNMLIKTSGALSAASVTYLIPIVAVLWGIWDNELFGVYHVLGFAAILMGVYLVNRQKRVSGSN